MKYVYFEDCVVVQDTAKALLVEVGAERIWIPRSQLHEDCELSATDDEGDLIIPAWLADKNDEIEADGEYEQ